MFQCCDAAEGEFVLSAVRRVTVKAKRQRDRKISAFDDHGNESECGFVFVRVLEKRHTGCATGSLPTNLSVSAWTGGRSFRTNRPRFPENVLRIKFTKRANKVWENAKKTGVRRKPIGLCAMTHLKHYADA